MFVQSCQYYQLALSVDVRISFTGVPYFLKKSLAFFSLTSSLASRQDQRSQN